MMHCDDGGLGLFELEKHRLPGAKAAKGLALDQPSNKGAQGRLVAYQCETAIGGGGVHHQGVDGLQAWRLRDDMVAGKRRGVVERAHQDLCGLHRANLGTGQNVVQSWQRLKQGASLLVHLSSAATGQSTSRVALRCLPVGFLMPLNEQKKVGHPGSIRKDPSARQAPSRASSTAVKSDWLCLLAVLFALGCYQHSVRHTPFQHRVVDEERWEEAGGKVRLVKLSVSAQNRIASSQFEEGEVALKSKLGGGFVHMRRVERTSTLELEWKAEAAEAGVLFDFSGALLEDADNRVELSTKIAFGPSSRFSTYDVLIDARWLARLNKAQSKVRVIRVTPLVPRGFFVEHWRLTFGAKDGFDWVMASMADSRLAVLHDEGRPIFVERWRLENDRWVRTEQWKRGFTRSE